MDFTPHTDADIERMLDELGISDPAGLFSHLPADVLLDDPLDLPEPLSEFEVMRYIDALGDRNDTGLIASPGAVSTTISSRPW